MNRSQFYSSIALLLWLAASWFFYLGYSSDLVAISMFFIPIVPFLHQQPNVSVQKTSIRSTLLSASWLGIGVGVCQVAAGLGGLSELAKLVFGNELIMIASNLIFAVRLIERDEL